MQAVAARERLQEACRVSKQAVRLMAEATTKHLHQASGSSKQLVAANKRRLKASSGMKQVVIASIHL